MLRAVTVLAIWGALIIGAIYMLRAVRAVMHGTAGANAENVTDANAWRKLPYVVLLASLLTFGFVPKLLTDKVKPDVEKIVALTNGGANTATPVASNK